MSVIDQVKALLGGADGAASITYECADCESTFTSAKSPDRAVCPDCLSHDVQPRG